MPRLRRLALAAAALGSCGAAAGAALAADQEVVARNAAFMPSQVTLGPSETLTIRHDDDVIQHNLQFSDEPARRVEASTGWTVQRTFTAAEVRDEPYTFFCSLHPGMSGSVSVRAPGGGTPSPTATASPGATPGATATPAPGTPGPGPGPAATLRSASVAPRACVRRGPRCRRPGVRLRIDLSAPADVRGTLRRRAPGARRFTRFGALRVRGVAAGPRILRFTRTAAGRRLRPGRYALALRAAGTTRTLRFRVV